MVASCDRASPKLVSTHPLPLITANKRDEPTFSIELATKLAVRLGK